MGKTLKTNQKLERENSWGYIGIGLHYSRLPETSTCWSLALVL